MATLQVVLLVLRLSNIRSRAPGERIVVGLAVSLSPGNISGLLLDWVLKRLVSGVELDKADENLSLRLSMLD